MLAPSYQHKNWHKLRHHVKVANSRRSCITMKGRRTAQSNDIGPDLYSQLSSRVGTNEGAKNYSIQLRFGQFGPRFILPAFLESGPRFIWAPSFPRESVKQEKKVELGWCPLRMVVRWNLEIGWSSGWCPLRMVVRYNVEKGCIW